MTLRMENVSEDQIDKTAQDLKKSIDRLMDRDWLPEMDGYLGFVADEVALEHHWETVRAGVEKKPLALCVDSGLDFLTRAGREIRYKTGRKPGAREKFRKHLTLCARCEIREECLDLAIRFNETRGIWGGTFPHERRTLRDMRGQNKCDDCGMFRKPEELEQGEYSVCKPGFGCAKKRRTP